MGLFEACRAYDPRKGRFGAIATTCVRRRVWRARLAAQARKHRILTEAYGLDHRRSGDDPGDETTIADSVPAPAGHDPAVIVELRDELRRRVKSGEVRPGGGRFTERQIATAVALVGDGHSLRAAGATVGASHMTVKQWVRNAA